MLITASRSYHNDGHDHVSTCLVLDVTQYSHLASFSVSDICTLKERGKYQGINEGVVAISNGVGPILGGLFAEYTTWYVFPPPSV